MTDIKRGSPMFLFRNLLLGAGKGADQAVKFDNPAIMKFGALVALPSLILFIAFRKLLTSETFISRKI